MSGETQNDVSGWTIDTVHSHLITMMNERDRRYNERFEAQEKAVVAALAAADKALDERAGTLSNEFHEHLQQYRHEVALAFEASDRAINKAEVATEKRFDAVNEFRGQLNDQAGSFILRTEATAAIDRNTERIQELADRFNRVEGRGAGLNAGWIYLLGAVAAIGTIVSIVVIFLV